MSMHGQPVERNIIEEVGKRKEMAHRRLLRFRLRISSSWPGNDVRRAPHRCLNFLWFFIGWINEVRDLREVKPEHTESITGTEKHYCARPRLCRLHSWDRGRVLRGRRPWRGRVACGGRAGGRRRILYADTRSLASSRTYQMGSLYCTEEKRLLETKMKSWNVKRPT
jgi:hypothetical protein